MKKLLSVTLIALSILTHEHAAWASQPEKKYTPENTTFTFDIDGVILESPESFYSTLLKHKTTILKTLFKPRLAWHIYQLSRQDTPYNYYALYFDKINEPGLVAIMHDIMYTEVPMPGTVQIIEELARKGYLLHIATNQTMSDFLFYKAKYPSVFGKFSPIKVVSFEEGKPLIVKPQLQYFVDLVEQLKQANEYKKHNIFIDDRMPNVDSSLKAGLEGIHFEHPTGLRKKLEALGILEAQPMPALPEKKSAATPITPLPAAAPAA